MSRGQAAGSKDRSPLSFEVFKYICLSTVRHAHFEETSAVAADVFAASSIL